MVINDVIFSKGQLIALYLTVSSDKTKVDLSIYNKLKELVIVKSYYDEDDLYHNEDTRHIEKLQEK
jgi:hypothetical protein